ncbi:putative calcineurin-like phosphoesterase [Synechococcus phage S-CBWM1]|uniref:Putative calcineurin-like phosphoesterase n=1 Tax=Synechococcus phage S-CBWM1 TaxID=2053653 RepID=A0A3G1L3H8_9CAUD|nr:metallo-phosphoesterase [Synechococcus phage S-CBWM1]ATW62700.1 putative calcineurin-like phosphoesterase [Synechococcus phage S-CBWM1]
MGFHREAGMQIRFIGDVHGKFGRYRKLIAPVENTLQVGDFGVGFRNLHGEYLANPPYDQMKKGNHFFVRGNHDNPAACRRHPFWIRDGDLAFDGRVFCVGGAESIDKGCRTEGCDWWADEELTYRELCIVLDLYEMAKPRVVVTHDAPQILLTTLYGNGRLHTPATGCGQRTRAMLDNMLEIHRPEIFIHGHWHQRWEMDIKGTRFIGLAELDHIDLDV